MLNGEKYKDELENLENRSLVCFIAKEKVGLRCDVGYCLKCEKEAFKWLFEECKEPILTDEEKVIVKDIINALKPFNFKFTHITKNGFSPEKKEYLSLICDKDDKYIWVESPKFMRGEKFVGMELNKAYTFEELGL